LASRITLEKDKNRLVFDITMVDMTIITMTNTTITETIAAPDVFLSDMKVGSVGRIVGLCAGEKVYRQRLLSMGLIPGTEFIVSRIAPLGDPIEITVRGFSLSLRKGEARILKIVGVPK
jgi:ferrous iron transport protein A